MKEYFFPRKLNGYDLLVTGHRVVQIRSAYS